MTLTQGLRKYGLLLFIALAPIAYLNNSDSRLFQENFFQLGSICIMAFFIGDLWIGSFLVLNVFLFVYNGGAVGFAQVLNILLGSLLFMVSRSWFKANRFSQIYKPLLIVFTLSLIFIGLQALSIDPLTNSVNGHGELLGTPNHDYSGLLLFKASSGIFSTICLPIMASLSLWLVPIAFVPIFLSSSTSVMMAFVVVVLFYTFFIHRKIFIYALGVCILCASLFLFFFAPKGQEKKFTSRLPLWHGVLKSSLINPIGYGPDSFRNFNKNKSFNFYGDYDYNLIVGKLQGEKIMLSYYSPTSDQKKIDALSESIIKDGMKGGVFSFWDNPHCEYLKVLFEYGIIGFFILCGFLRDLFIRFRFSNKDKEMIVITSCLLVYFITALTHFPLELARTAYLFPIILGAFYQRTDLYVQH